MQATNGVRAEAEWYNLTCGDEDGVFTPLSVNPVFGDISPVNVAGYFPEADCRAARRLRFYHHPSGLWF
jgi:hypothetical protein